MRGARASSSPTTAPPTSLARLSPILEDTENVPQMASVSRTLGTDSGGPCKSLCSHLGRAFPNTVQKSDSCQP